MIDTERADKSIQLWTRNKLDAHSEADLVRSYINTKRVFTAEYLTDMQWPEDFDLSSDLVRVFYYFRLIEGRTGDTFFPYLAEGPSGRDQFLLEFLNKWKEEELTHAELFDRCLRIALKDRYVPYTKPALPSLPQRGRRLVELAFNFTLSTHFKALHMVWGMISELTTRLGYNKLRESITDPFLQKMINDIIKEETVHANFYEAMARIKLEKSILSQFFCETIIRLAWYPVGAEEGNLADIKPIIEKFRDNKTLKDFHDTVTKKVQSLPGFRDLDLTCLFAKHIQAIPT